MTVTVILEGRGAFAGQMLRGVAERVHAIPWPGEVLVRLPSGLGVFFALSGAAAGMQVAGGDAGWRLRPDGLGVVRCQAGLSALEGAPCTFDRCLFLSAVRRRS